MYDVPNRPMPITMNDLGLVSTSSLFHYTALIARRMRTPWRLRNLSLSSRTSLA
jgi:hypothetical protein